MFNANENKNQYWSSSCGRLSLIFKNADQVLSIACPGDAENATREALSYFKENGDQLAAYDNKLLRMHLVSCGLESEEVEAMDRDTLELYTVWIAAGDQRDEIENAENYNEE